MGFFDSLADYAQDAYTAVSDVVSDTADALEEVVDEVYESTSDAVSQLAEEVGNFADQVVQATSDAAEKIKEIVEDSTKKVLDAAKDALEGAEELAKWGVGRVESLAERAQRQVTQVVHAAMQAAAETGEFIMDSFDAARRYAEGAVENVYNKLKTIYLNVGCWDIDDSNFGLVCGRYAVLCSWLEGGRLQLPNPSKPGDEEAQKQIKEFLDVTSNEETGAKPGVQGFDVALKPLTDDGDLLVFIGDLHVNLFPLSKLDGFARPGGSGQERRSLAADFNNFLKHAASQVKGASTDKIIQCGDCYETWGAQIVFHLGCEQYRDVATTPASERDRDQTKIATIVRGTALEIKPDEPQDSKSVRKRFLDRATPKLVKDILGMYAAEWPENFDEALNLTNSTAVQDQIKAVYRGAHEIDWDVFTVLPGNHDNDIANSWLAEREQYGESSGGHGRDPYIPVPYGRVYEAGENAGKQCIGAEHGEKLDASNARPEFEKGFKVTIIFIETGKLHMGFWGPLIPDPVVDFVEAVSDKALAVYTRDRARELRGSWLPDEGGQRWRLIVLGHSHDCVVTGDDILEMAKDEAKYYGSWALNQII